MYLKLNRSHGANAHKHRAGTVTRQQAEGAGLCEVLVCGERTVELPPNVGTGAPRAAAKTEKSEVWEIAQVLLTLLSFSEDEAAEAKPTCPFVYVRLPPAPPADFGKVRTCWFCAEWRTNGGKRSGCAGTHTELVEVRTERPRGAITLFLRKRFAQRIVPHRKVKLLVS